MKRFYGKIAPPWLVLFADLLICTIALFIAYQLRFNFNVPGREVTHYKIVWPVMLGIRFITFLLSGSFKGVVRYTATSDVLRLLLTVLVGSMIMAMLNPVWLHFEGFHLVPYNVLLIDFLVSIFLIVGSRMAFKVIYRRIALSEKTRHDIIIYGAGEDGLIAKRALDTNIRARYNVVAFLDDNSRLENVKLEDVRVWHTSRLEILLEKYRDAELIFANKRISAEMRQHVVDVCLKYEVRVYDLPPLKTWLESSNAPIRLQEVKIEDLLARDAIQIDNPILNSEFFGKVVLVTGAAGSIGSELARQLIDYKPARLICVDQAETPMYELDILLSGAEAYQNVSLRIADITDAAKMEQLFGQHRPDYVFHAAAYKHVPLMEKNPAEAIKVNVLGTQIIADLAHRYKARKMVLISTDKAVNPTNVMGASKRIAELYIQSFNDCSETQFITTRFGNVLGSNGSVIPRFRKQIEEGGPITVTHPEVTRYFMTIPEACSLVLEAGAMSQGGEVFIFDMGKPVKIADLARKMIKLSGLEPDVDIKVVFTGLRPGEKLYEELLISGEDHLPTHHPKIMIARVIRYGKADLDAHLNELAHLVRTQNNQHIVAKMKEIVPEYKSANSEFEKLDVKQHRL
ncbi:MAG: polysaccharide biosynthesis protein [Bacteroidia bacterium]|nr:polysaccharide biosynthesis protein [Bacteroidia bacterium]